MAKVLTKEAIRKKFEEFLAEPFPVQMEAYGNQHPYILAKVFVITERQTIIDPMNIGSGDDRAIIEYTFPIAKVYQVGSYFQSNQRYVDVDGNRHTYKAGDLLRLKDEDALTMVNPNHKAYKNNEFKDSNMTPVNPAPPSMIQRLWDTHGRRMFIPPCFQMDVLKVVNNIFFFDEPNILMPVVDWEKLFEGWE